MVCDCERLSSGACVRGALDCIYSPDDARDLHQRGRIVVTNIQRLCFSVSCETSAVGARQVEAVGERVSPWLLLLPSVQCMDGWMRKPDLSRGLTMTTLTMSAQHNNTAPPHGKCPLQLFTIIRYYIVRPLFGTGVVI
jgi:hypothetical protein